MRLAFIRSHRTHFGAAFGCHRPRAFSSKSGEKHDPGMKALVKRLESDPIFMREFIGCLSNDGKLRFANSILGKRFSQGFSHTGFVDLSSSSADSCGIDSCVPSHGTAFCIE